MKTTIAALFVGAMITGAQAAEKPTNSSTNLVETATTANDGKPMPPLEMPRSIGSDQHYGIHGTVNFSEQHHGDIHRFRVKGATHGSVWGSGVYTSDSHLGVAAVHAGILKDGETGVVTVRIVDPPSSFDADKRHGVSTHSWGHWGGAFEFLKDSPMSEMKAGDRAYSSTNLVETATTANDGKPMPPLEMPRSIGSDQHYGIHGIVNFSEQHHGDIHRFRVKGATHGSVWGSGVYTSDSHLGVAAVHAGILKDGETGVVTVRIVDPPSSFDADKRHGVSTHSWGHWGGAFEFLKDSPMSEMKAGDRS